MALEVVGAIEDFRALVAGKCSSTGFGLPFRIELFWMGFLHVTRESCFAVVDISRIIGGRAKDADVCSGMNSRLVASKSLDRVEDSVTGSPIEIDSCTLKLVCEVLGNSEEMVTLNMRLEELLRGKWVLLACC